MTISEKIKHALGIKNAILKNLYNKPEITEEEVQEWKRGVSNRKETME